jgi:hypothetical protein
MNVETMLIVVEGPKTSAGGRDTEYPPQGECPRRLPDSPRKAKHLERRSTVECKYFWVSTVQD